MPAPQPAPTPARLAARSGALRDLLVVAAVTVLFFAFAASVELSERFAAWAHRHESWELDELFLALLVLCAGLAWFSWRRQRERSREVQARLQLESAMRLAVQQNRELARHLLQLQEDERSSIARELHDELAQLCVAIRVEAAGIEDEARGRDLPGVSAGARAIRDAVDHLHGSVREMLTRLRPPMLDALGLEASLRNLAGGWSQRHGIACAVQVDPACERVADEVRVALFRVAQEALTNVARHAGASQAQLSLQSEQEGQVLLLTVDDDGHGMPAAGRDTGLGLVGIAERVGVLGGSLALAASPRGGVCLAVRVPATPRPVPEDAEEAAA